MQFVRCTGYTFKTDKFGSEWNLAKPGKNLVIQHTSPNI